METKMLLEDWLDDLCVRFIINLPQEELESVERICFQVEEAQWFYEDFIRPLDPTLPSMSLRNFCLRIFQHCPLLSDFSTYHHSTAFSEFLAYKTRVPVRGAIMLNEAMDEVVLVKGWKKGANWSFPRGKINKDERDLDCAVREVYEETGFDLREAGLVGEEPQMKYIEVTMREQHMRLYVFRGVPMDTHFEPRTRKEISKIQWYKLSELPTLKKSRQQQQGRGEDLAINANKFYMVAPFLVPLKKWIHQQSKHDALRGPTDERIASAEFEQLIAEEATPSAEIIPTTDEARAASTAQLPQPNEVDNSATARDKSSTAQPAGDASAQLKRLLSVKDTSLMSRNTPPVVVQARTANLPDPGALLALLRNGNDSLGTAHPSRTMPLQTPMEQVIATPMMPEPPHHQHSRLPHLSRLPTPPSFPFPTLDPQDLPRHPSQPPTSVHPTTKATTAKPDSNVLEPFLQSDNRSNRLPSPGHPLPAGPPTQGPIFLPPSHDSRQAPRPYQRTGDPNFVQAPQFAKLHVPIIPPASKLPPPKLTSHSLALLNVFKNAKSATSHNVPGLDNVNEPSKLPVQTAAGPTGQPREGQDQMSTARLTEGARTWNAPPKPDSNKPSTINGSMNGIPGSGLAPSKPRKQHQDTLLELFRKPSGTVVTATPPKTSSATLAPVELSAQPSPAILRQALPHNVDRTVKPAHQQGLDTSTDDVSKKPFPEPLSMKATNPSATVSGPLNMPQFGASARKEGRTKQTRTAKQTANGTDRKRATPTSILARSVSAQAPQAVDGQTSQSSHAVPVTRRQPSAPAPKPFQPQILRRPAQVEPQTQPRASPNSLFVPPLDSCVDRATDHKQSLLSLFSTPAAIDTSSPTSFSDVISPLTEKLPGVSAFDASPLRSRMGSISSLKGDDQGRKPPGSGSQTPHTPVDRTFLLGYLEGVVKSELR